MSASIARVLIDSPLPQLDRLFDYRVPEPLAALAVPGVRVRAPLRSAGRVAEGWIVELAESAAFGGTLSELESVVSPVAVLAPEIAALARRVADRSAGGASDVVRLAVPPRRVRVEKAWLASPRQSLPPVAPVALAEYGSALDEAIDRGARVALRVPPGGVATGEQTRAHGEERAGAPADGRWVLRWADVLARAARRAIAAGGSAILAVPDHRDLEQLLAALARVLPPERIARLDAGQPDTDRYRDFLRCLAPDPLVIVGNRSVVYAPARRLALLALWDDGDPLYAEPLAPYANARDVALVRQEQQGGALVLAAHTRSTDVERLVELGWLESVAPRRTTSPRVVLTALQEPQDALSAHARIPSSAWRLARGGLDAGPVLVQVARPGWSPLLVCADCGQQARCARCDGPLGVRTASGPPACAWCGAIAADWRCPHCTGARLLRSGSGSARTAEDLGRAFPGVRVVLADGEHPHLTVPDRPALVVATRGAEPVADGGYRAVLLLDGERMVARESLRVAEDCLRWWSNAAALAAPEGPVVLVGVGGSLAAALATWRQDAFAREELADRRRLRFPPAVRTATVTGTPEAVAEAVERVAALGADTLAPSDVLGPVETGPGTVRSILRFDYVHGPAVARELRAEVVRLATARRAGPPGRRAPGRPPIRVRLDDPEPFD